MAQQQDKPEALRIVSTQGGYAVFFFPSSQPAAVFTSGFDLLDWVAERVAHWETERGDREQAVEPAVGLAGDGDTDSVPVDA